MSREAESCRVIFDDDGRISALICQRLDMSLSDNEGFAALGFLLGERLVGGVLFSGVEPGGNAWLSIYADDKRWCNRRILRVIFGVAFELLGCNRISALINVDNRASLRLAEGVGFRKEGKMRQYRDNGRDVYVLGMLKSECKFLKYKGEKNV